MNINKHELETHTHSHAHTLACALNKDRRQIDAYVIHSDDHDDVDGSEKMEPVLISHWWHSNGN